MNASVVRLSVLAAAASALLAYSPVTANNVNCQYFADGKCVSEQEFHASVEKSNGGRNPFKDGTFDRMKNDADDMKKRMGGMGDMGGVGGMSGIGGNFPNLNFN